MCVCDIFSLSGKQTNKQINSECECSPTQYSVKAGLDKEAWLWKWEVSSDSKERRNSDGPGTEEENE